MAVKLQAIRGMHDVLPEQTPTWQWLEEQCRAIVQSYGYHEIRMPIVEASELFSRSIGEATDIVEKEMYSFLDRNGDSVSLRPEGTASCVRAALEGGLLHNQIQRLWYMGPMFRHERPQKGRYRQFYQLGVEAYGLATPEIEAELLYLSWRLFQRLNLSSDVTLQMNTLGSYESRAQYRDELVKYLAKFKNELDEDSRRRLQTNPLRILDSKDPKTCEILKNAPKLSDFLSADDQTHFAKVLDLVEKRKIPCTVNPLLVRGLDYYCHTVFEWVTESLGAQGTVCAGGRYDALVEQLGGQATPAIGFAAGLERLVLLINQKQSLTKTIDLFVILMGEQALAEGFPLIEKLRDACPNLVIENSLGGGGFKNQFKRADKSGARYALLIGDDEIAVQKMTLKNLREEAPQQLMTIEEVIQFFNDGRT